MHVRLARSRAGRRLLSGVLSGAAWLALGLPAVQAQVGAPPGWCPPSPCLPAPWPARPLAPAPQAPAPQTPATTAPQQPPGQAQQPTPEAAQQQTPQAPQAQEPSLDVAQSAAVGGENVAVASSNVGYIDQAVPRTQFRLRYDAGFNMNRPDRAEFFYGEWRELSFHPHGVAGDGVFFDPHARGPEALPGRLDYQEVSSYFEWAYNNRFSAFAEVPVRFVDFDNLQEEPDLERLPNGRFFPEPRTENTAPPHTNFGGLSDIQFGFKAALLADPDQYLTFQLRTYTPTGYAGHGLGTGHWSLEPALLLYERLTDRLAVEAEFRDWIPIDGGDAAGNVLRYGVGVGYDVYRSCNLRVTPVVEFVGWTVLNGFEAFSGPVVASSPSGLPLPRFHGVEDASGDTIVNAKVGVRTYLGQHNDFYVGFGKSLTGDRWYDEIVRVEYRLAF